jgi:hypothetical protein
MGLGAFVVGSDEAMRVAVGSEAGLLFVDERDGNRLGSSVVGSTVGRRGCFIVVGFALMSVTSGVGSETGCVIGSSVGVPVSVSEEKI